MEYAYIRIKLRANDQLSLSVRDGGVVLANDDPNDDHQVWVKEARFVKDPVNTFALINLATGQAIKAAGNRNPLQLDHFDPNNIDELLLWNKGARAIRMATNNDENFDAFSGHGIKDGTPVGLWGWNAGNNQIWDFTPRPPKMTLVRLVSKFDTEDCLTLWDNVAVLSGINPNDQYQQWQMMQRGAGSFVFVNSKIDKALQSSIKRTPLLRCSTYTPYNADGFKWSTKALEDGFSAINISGEDVNRFNLTVIDVNGGTEGTVVVLSSWADNNKQKWKIVPICENLFPNQSAF